MRFAYFVLGPAGSGKSKFCSRLFEHCQLKDRNLRMVNLDPAAEAFEYPVAIDVRELISVEEVLEESDYGPNGGLIFAMEYLLENLDFILNKLDDYDENDYFIFDCPGQIELYTHFPIMPRIVRELERHAFRVGTLYLIDSEAVNDIPKFVGGTLSALTASLHMAVPQLNILTKLDLFHGSLNSRSWGGILDPSKESVLQATNRALPPKYQKLNSLISGVLDDYSLINFMPLNYSDPESIDRILYQMDYVIQYGDELEPAGKDLPSEQDDDLDLMTRMKNLSETFSTRNQNRVHNDPN